MSIRNTLLEESSFNSTSALNGDRAFTVQSYNEVNSKKGQSFELSALFEDAAQGTPAKAIFLTGSKPVIFKDRSFGYTGTAIKADIFRGPTYTGGSALDIQNTNDISPVATTVTILQGATVTDDGVKFASTAYLLGGTRNQSKGNASQSLASEYILKPNTAYLLMVESLDSSSQDIAVHNGWFEGEPDIS